ncbi:MAG TPA: biotin/lipoyl-containing protein [Candidatus Limnocylindrales bacterium]
MTDPGRDAPPPFEAAAAPAPSPVPVMAESDSPVDPGDKALFGVIDRLAAILDHSDLLELEIQVGDTGLTLRKPTALAQPVAVAGPGAAVAASPGSGPAGAPGGGAAGPAAAGAAAPVEAPAARPSVKAPLTGIWYGSPAPGSAPYVQAGSEIAVGTVIGLIEAMKLFNEIKSDLAGRVVKVHAEDGKLVKAKQPLIEVEPL